MGIRSDSGADSERPTNLDRQRALAEAESLASQGVILGAGELDARKRAIASARTRKELKGALADVTSAAPRRAKRGDLRASDSERANAIQRLTAHAAQGHISEDERSRREVLVEQSQTPNEIAEAFKDLPALTARARVTGALIGDAEREAARKRLLEQHTLGRITIEEYSAAAEQVAAARTDAELRAAHSLVPEQNAAARTAAKAQMHGTRVVAEGGRRAGAAITRLAIAFCALLLAVVAAFALGGVAAFVCFAVAVLFFVAAIRALLFGADSRSPD